MQLSIMVMAKNWLHSLLFIIKMCCQAFGILKLLKRNAFREVSKTITFINYNYYVFSTHKP